MPSDSHDNIAIRALNYNELFNDDNVRYIAVQHHIGSIENSREDGAGS